MSYNYEGFEFGVVADDLRARGYSIGASATPICIDGGPYDNGHCFVMGNDGVAPTTNTPGTNASDPLVFPLSNKTFAQLREIGGFGVYFRAMTWISQSVISTPCWIGDQWFVPTSGQVSENVVGLSKNLSRWDFVPASGSANSYLYPSRVLYDGTNVSWIDTVDEVLICRYGTPSTGFNTREITGYTGELWNGAYSNGILVHTGTGSILTSVNSPGGIWSVTPVPGAAEIYGIVNIPGTDIWVMCGNNGNITRSTDNLLTTETIMSVSGFRLYTAAASDTSVIVVGQGSRIYRSVDQGASFEAVASPVANLTLVNVVYANGVYVIGSYNSKQFFVSADDGLTWDIVDNPTLTITNYLNGRIFDGIRFENGRFISTAVSDSNQSYCICTSVDGYNWEVVFNAAVSTTGASGTNARYSPIGMFSRSSTGTVGTILGFLINATTAASNSNPLRVTVANVGPMASTIGLNQWHEYQIIVRPGTAAGTWNISYGFDQEFVEFGPATIGSVDDHYPWFNVARNAQFTLVDDVVFTDFTTDEDPGQLGPDWRIYGERPTEDVSVQWNKYPPEVASNAEAISQRSVTQSTTQVQTGDLNQIDVYQMQNLIPEGMSILSVTNEAFFSRLFSTTQYAIIGTELNGDAYMSPPTAISSDVGSYTFLQHRLDTNPETNVRWTHEELQSAYMRIRNVLANPGVDPYWGYVRLLVHFDNDFTDASAFISPTIGGSVEISAIDPKFGIGCSNFPSNGYLSYSSAPLGSGDFTIEGWCRRASVTDTENKCLVSAGSNVSGTGGYFVGVLSNGSIGFYDYTGTTTLRVQTSDPIIPNQWNHWYATRYQGTFYVGLNGIGIGGQSGNGNFTLGVHNIGRWISGTPRPYIGQIDDVRITVGVARYTSGSYEIPTTSFPDQGE